MDFKQKLNLIWAFFTPKLAMQNGAKFGGKG